MTRQERFDAKWLPEPNSGCWLWTAALTQTGSYAKFGWTHGDAIHGHRAAWRLYRGEIPEGMFACHRCDTPACVNPDHLFLGLPRDNTHDSIAKGRFVNPPVLHGDANPMRRDPSRAARGERANKSRITTADVLAIRDRTARGESKHTMAEEFDVTWQAINSIAKRRNWGHV